MSTKEKAGEAADSLLAALEDVQQSQTSEAQHYRVLALKALLESGGYQVDKQSLAEKLLADGILAKPDKQIR